MDAIAVDALGTGDRSFVPDKPDEGFDVIPMWVADMNFPTCPAIPKAIIDRTEHPAYGYFDIRKEYYDEIIKWHEVRNGVTGLTEDCIGYENGVLGGVLSALGIFCSKGDNVLLHSPTYIGFTNSLKNSGYNIIHSPLKKDAQGVWRMDFEDMEEKIKSRHIHATVFCSPHNPCGRVWTREEILQFTELCRKYDVKIISDEIWSDMTLFGNRHIPTQSVSEDARNRTVALYAPSKTFNLAGLVGSYHIIYNAAIRDRVRKESSLSHYNNMNVLSMYALIGAYSLLTTLFLTWKSQGRKVHICCSQTARNIARGQERASMMCSVLHGESASRYRMDARSTENATQGSIWHFRFQE